MSECFTKARELGRMILTSEYAIRLSDAEAALAEAGNSDHRETAIHDWREAQNDFNRFTEQVADMVKASVYGDIDDASCCASNADKGASCGSDDASCGSHCVCPRRA